MVVGSAINPHLDRPPAVNETECFLTALFLRRYITYCARRRRYAQMEGAARQYRENTVVRDVLA